MYKKIRSKIKIENNKYKKQFSPMDFLIFKGKGNKNHFYKLL